ncbi:MAG: histidine phosphatase family protein [Proteobacteria bacterium]|nr:histidine phosphatase family protein [Pseudomonadota bacterium]HQR04135.1 histidine phosphatase family protein [Rhodocyclaceae bacterium]
MEFYLIRHPLPAVAPGTCYGRTDLDVAEDVAAVAARIAPALPENVVLYTSPLQRCRKLAQALHPSPRADARLQEMDFGQWEMRPWDAIGRTTINAWVADRLGYRPPGGETVGELQARVLMFLDECSASGHPAVALVTHAGVIKVLSGALRGLAPAAWFSLEFEYGSVTRLKW